MKIDIDPQTLLPLIIFFAFMMLSFIIGLITITINYFFH